MFVDAMLTLMLESSGTKKLPNSSTVYVSIGGSAMGSCVLRASTDKSQLIP